ncbi:MAG TPA: DinB family protein [Gemmatimonadaceae bacterium]|nr:DinB family protein [Gemmatimonadaceae bacterium]
MSIAQTLLPEYDMEMDATRRVLALVPESQATWKPHEKSFSLGSLAMHLHNFPTWGMFTISRDSLDLTSPEASTRVPFTTTDALLTSFDQGVTACRSMLADTSDDAMHALWTLKHGERSLFSMPRIAVLRTSVFNHMVHHRGQMTVYLRMLDVPLPDIYGPTADTLAS